MKQKAVRHPFKDLTPQRSRLFKLVAVSIPILFFVLLECSLRLFHYGPDLSLFSVETINGQQYYTLNPSVKNRYFSRIHYSPDPSPEYFLVTKPPGTFRIFCLGGSTTVGYPYWYNGAFASFLRDRLKAIFPNRSLEIINLGITATNSFTVLDVSNDVMEYSPDLLIVYDGHNEFYGVLGGASNDRVAPARWMTLLYLRMIHLRTFQLAKNIIAETFAFFGKAPIDYSNRATMMEQVSRGKNVPYGNSVYTKCFDVFRANLNDLAERCRDKNIPLILSTQVSDIRDQHPFISNHSAGISEQQRSLFQQYYKSGLNFQSHGAADSAIACFRSALIQDVFYADVHYRLAQCLDALGKKREAYAEYILARDDDELRFRTDSKFNNLIRSMENRDQVFVADIEGVFQTHSPDSLIGHNLIFEHLHPTSHGHFLMAKEYARLMRVHGLLASSDEWTKCDTVKDDFLWEHRHITDVDEFLAGRKTEFLTSGWPFKSESVPIMSLGEADTLRTISDQAARNQIGWENAHRRAAEYYIQRGDFENADRENETIISQFPFDIAAYIRLAQLYFKQNELPKAETVIVASLHVQRAPIAVRILADIYLKRGEPEKAVPYYEELNKIPADPNIIAENSYMLAIAYLRSQKPESAIHTLESIINRYPAYQPARDLLSKMRLYAKTHPLP